tara:strand:- start:1694 stop:1999 length:306 start_codon:yes stop_codon:yes gene_type:complete
MTELEYLDLNHMTSTGAALGGKRKKRRTSKKAGKRKGSRRYKKHSKKSHGKMKPTRVLRRLSKRSLKNLRKTRRVVRRDFAKNLLGINLPNLLAKKRKVKR